MSDDRPTVLTQEVTPTPHPPEPDVEKTEHAIKPEPLDWDAAVHAAGVLLDERFGPIGAVLNPAMTDMAQELAARLCAYDEITEAVEHMQSHRPAPPADP
jgi:hypothetical protein